jgi:hypothetical protein
MTIISEDQMIVAGTHKQPLVHLSLKKQKEVSKIHIKGEGESIHIVSMDQFNDKCLLGFRMFSYPPANY